MADPTTPNESREINGEESITEAVKKVSAKINSIVETLGKDPPATVIRTYPDHYFVTKYPDGYMSIAVNTDILGGYGYNHNTRYIPPELRKDGEETGGETRQIYLARFSETDTDGTGIHGYEPSGINSPWELFVGVHTDMQTVPQIKALLEKRPNMAYILGSYYYFDDEGNYEKNMILPPGIEDDRPVLETFGDTGFRRIKCEIEPGEFELISFALGVLEKGAQAN